MDHRSVGARRNHGSNRWLTCDEVAFVQGLGTYTKARPKTSRLTWLQRYIEAAGLRGDWGEIKKAVVLKEATRLLRAEQRNASQKAA